MVSRFSVHSRIFPCYYGTRRRRLVRSGLRTPPFSLEKLTFSWLRRNEPAQRAGFKGASISADAKDRIFGLTRLGVSAARQFFAVSKINMAWRPV